MADGRPASRPNPGLLILCYGALLGIVPLAASRNREVRWHAWNGLLMFAAVAVVGILATLAGILFPSVSCLYGVAMLIVTVLYVAVVVLAVVIALQGRRLLVPVISRHATRLAAR
jgi:uncharacterized membrane protein